MRTDEEVAYILMSMLKRSGKSRFRLSRKSLQEISGRDVLRTALVRNINDWMEGYSFLLPLNRGGYVVVSQESLEGIAPLKIADVLPNWKQLKLEQMRDEIDEEADDE